MGGPDKVKRQHDGGKLTVRERVDRLLDPGSFHEIGGLAGVAQYREENCAMASWPISRRPTWSSGAGASAGGRWR